MKYHSRKLIKPGDLNANNTLFGGALLKWIDEEAGIYVTTKLQTKKVVTKYISEINFVSSAKQGDVIEIGVQFLSIGKSSISIKCEVRNIMTKKIILEIDKMVFVKIDEKERPVAHEVTLENMQNLSQL